ncbi:Putative ankyrin repeat-containing domain superfamily [Colletotrichum destructivum]|uniref:Ankyrin repeat-containing domain superfamily n=1 Tax=Colletotrichum destructivum TaxID=34406 RepID=A0AAX4J1W0_9PEZI|nr:Putative ankyrin repeat-containing domain superfamily [Colletotrichum destructivum]
MGSSVRTYGCNTELCSTGQVEVNLRETKYGLTPLSWATENGHESVVKMLLDTGKIDVNSSDKHNRSPVSWAASNGHGAVVILLLGTSKVSVDLIDTEGRTALSWAARKGKENTVSLLVQNSKRMINYRDNRGFTPLMWALARSHHPVVEVLSRSGNLADDSYKERLAFHAFNFMSAAELEKFMADIGYAGLDDFLGLQALFYL